MPLRTFVKRGTVRTLLRNSTVASFTRSIMRTSAIFVEFTTPWSLLATHHVIRGQFSAYELPFSKPSNRSVEDDRFWHVFALPNLFNEIG